jgi:hypothetical protein
MSFRTQAITAVLSYLHVSGDDISTNTHLFAVFVVPYHSDATAAANLLRC